MPEYLAPGVYVEEVDTGAKPIEGVSTSTAGMVGVTERGPVNVPIFISSMGEFRRWFGGNLNSNLFGENRYLPHAVDGFFTNGGKRLFVTRVAPDVTDAAVASVSLFAEGATGAGETVLFRDAEEGTGNAVNTPLLYILDPAGLNNQDMIRIGNGSSAEYHEIDNIVDAEAVALSVPLVFDYAAGTDVLVHAQDSRSADFHDATFTINTVNVGDPAPGSDSVTLTVAAAVPANTAAAVVLLAAEANLLIRFGAADSGEYRLANHLSDDGVEEMTFALDRPLERSYASGEIVIILNTVAGGNLDSLRLDAGAGERIVLLAGDNAPYGDPKTLIELNGVVGNREFIRIGQLAGTELAVGSSDQLPVGSRIESDASIQNHAVIAYSPAAGATPAFIEISDASLFSAGEELVVESGTPELAVIGSVDYDNNELNLTADLVTPAVANDDVHSRVHSILERTASAYTAIPGDPAFVEVDNASLFSVGEEVIFESTGESTVIDGIDEANNHLILSGDLANDPVAGGDTLIHSPEKMLSEAAAEGNVEVQLDNRTSLEVADVIRIGDEFVEILDIPGGRKPSPDSGSVLLTSALKQSHNAGDTVQKVHQSAVGNGDLIISSLMYSVDEGGTELVFTNGEETYLVGDVVRVVTPRDKSYLHVVGANSTPLQPQEVMLTNAQALSGSHASGSIIAEREELQRVQALDPGGWGNRLRVSVEAHENGLVPIAEITDTNGLNEIQLSAPSGVEAGTVMQLLDAQGDQVGDPVKVSSVGIGPDYALTIQDGLADNQVTAINGGLARARSMEFRLAVMYLRQPDPAAPSRNDTVIDSEVFEYLSMDPRHSRYIGNVIGVINGDLRLSDRRPEGQSWYIRVADMGASDAEREAVRVGPENLEDSLPRGRTRPARRALIDGDDRMALVNHETYIGQDNREPELRTGLFSLQNKEEISIVAIPGQTNSDIQGALITHCESMRYRFAVLDGPPPPSDTLTDVRNQRQQFDTKYAALYHPWLLVSDPYPRNLQDIPDYPIPPSGSMAGIYARTDVERGVHKAPANTVVKGIRGLQRQLNKAEHELLNPSPVNINVIRDFRRNGRGIRVWGGRCITSDTDWKYVNVRRLMIYIEASIDIGLQWVVFEPNAEPLWARVRRTITNFLTTVWRNGALEGTSVEEAFFVKCDRTTMTQTDIDNGKLICEIGVAPVKPAEFVIIRIGLWTAHAED